MAVKALYFGYASCMLKERLQNSVPNPEFKTIARLPDYKIAFGVESPKWHGNMAQATPSQGSDLWGVVWEVPEEEMQILYRQEGVDKGKFKAEEVEVFPPEGSSLHVTVILPLVAPSDGALPSPQYKKVIIEGAEKCGIPTDYINKLKEMPDNGYAENIDLEGGNF